jgi:N-acetylglucosamine transport system substrate-binding protein
MTSTGKYPYYFEHFVLRGAVAAEGGAQALLDWKELKPGFFTSDVFKNVIKKYEWVVKNGYLLEGSEALNHVESQLEWINGNTAFVTSGTWIESEMSKDFPEGFKDGIRYLPSFFVDADSEMAVVPYGDASIAVFKDGGNTAAAKEFVKALYSEKMMMKMTEITNILSNVPSANQKAAKSPAIESALGWLNSLNQVAWPEGGYITQEITKDLQSLLQALMVGDETADSFCEKLEATAERIRKDSSVTFIDAYIPE